MQKIIMNKHLNHNKTLFGGILMAWIDELCALEVDKNYFTVNFNMDFSKKIFEGDIVDIKIKDIKHSKNSQKMLVIVYVEGEERARTLVTFARKKQTAIRAKIKELLYNLECETGKCYKNQDNDNIVTSKAYIDLVSKLEDITRNV